MSGETATAKAYAGTRSASHEHYRALLKTAHAGMDRLLTAMGLVDSALEGNKVPESQIKALKSSMPATSSSASKAGAVAVKGIKADLLQYCREAEIAIATGVERSEAQGRMNLRGATSSRSHAENPPQLAAIKAKVVQSAVFQKRVSEMESQLCLKADDHGECLVHFLCPGPALLLGVCSRYDEHAKGRRRERGVLLVQVHRHEDARGHQPPPPQAEVDREGFAEAAGAAPAGPGPGGSAREGDVPRPRDELQQDRSVRQGGHGEGAAGPRRGHAGHARGRGGERGGGRDQARGLPCAHAPPRGDDQGVRHDRAPRDAGHRRVQRRAPLPRGEPAQPPARGRGSGGDGQAQVLPLGSLGRAVMPRVPPRWPRRCASRSCAVRRDADGADFAYERDVETE